MKLDCVPAEKLILLWCALRGPRIKVNYREISAYCELSERQAKRGIALWRERGVLVPTGSRGVYDLVLPELALESGDTGVPFGEANGDTGVPNDQLSVANGDTGDTEAWVTPPPSVPPLEPPPIIPPVQVTPEELEAQWEAWWDAYPRKTGMRYARAEWIRIVEDNPGMANVLFEALERHKQSQQWREADGKYIPGPLKWLTERRWKGMMDGGDQRRWIG